MTVANIGRARTKRHTGSALVIGTAPLTYGVGGGCAQGSRFGILLLKFFTLAMAMMAQAMQQASLLLRAPVRLQPYNQALLCIRAAGMPQPIRLRLPLVSARTAIFMR